ncbi:MULTISPECIES: GntR family transcriptional regulator [Pseudophaeobacter]|jgi:GntR family carbon starvation induced transcriptional regulator|uniref:GntR family transcriptional regulator n=1 Tax=Pseudophaeobacter TaxID=1541822 RepID=UPI0028BE8EBC|nr:GntR family transcriptional regulator [Pseudophaeobacter profundi]
MSNILQNRVQMLFGSKQDEDETVVAMLASALRRDISFGLLRPDEKLKLNGLRQRYGGSNHSMRETLRLLSAEGLVAATAQRGFRVTSATSQDQQDILFMRVQIEKMALERALKLGDVAWEGRILAAHHAMRHRETLVQEDLSDLAALEWDNACRGFFYSLCDASDSPRLLDTQQKYYDQSRRFRLAALREGRLDFAQRAAQHHALLTAALARDTGTALGLLETVITTELQA